MFVGKDTTFDLEHVIKFLLKRSSPSMYVFFFSVLSFSFVLICFKMKFLSKMYHLTQLQGCCEYLILCLHLLQLVQPSCAILLSYLSLKFLCILLNLCVELLYILNDTNFCSNISFKLATVFDEVVCNILFPFVLFLVVLFLLSCAFLNFILSNPCIQYVTNFSNLWILVFCFLILPRLFMLKGSF